MSAEGGVALLELLEEQDHRIVLELANQPPERCEIRVGLSSVDRACGGMSVTWKRTLRTLPERHPVSLGHVDLRLAFATPGSCHYRAVGIT